MNFWTIITKYDLPLQNIEEKRRVFKIRAKYGVSRLLLVLTYLYPASWFTPS